MIAIAGHRVHRKKASLALMTWQRYTGDFPCKSTGEVDQAATITKHPMIEKHVTTVINHALTGFQPVSLIIIVNKRWGYLLRIDLQLMDEAHVVIRSVTKTHAWMQPDLCIDIDDLTIVYSFVHDEGYRIWTNSHCCFFDGQKHGAMIACPA